MRLFEVLGELEGLEECLDGGVVGSRHEQVDNDALAGIGNLGDQFDARCLVPGEVDGLPGVLADGDIFTCFVAVALGFICNERLGVVGLNIKGDGLIALVDILEANAADEAAVAAIGPDVIALGTEALNQVKSYGCPRASWTPFAR